LEVEVQLVEEVVLEVEGPLAQEELVAELLLEALVLMVWEVRLLVGLVVFHKFLLPLRIFL
jgi:hypothetical protein